MHLDQKIYCAKASLEQCQAAGILKNGEIRIEKEPEWKYKALAPATKEFFGKKITQTALQSMKPEDRKRIAAKNAKW